MVIDLLADALPQHIVAVADPLLYLNVVLIGILQQMALLSLLTGGIIAIFHRRTDLRLLLNFLR